MHLATGYIMAAKIVPIEEDGLESMEKEIEILKKCRSGHIVSYYGTCLSRTEQKLWVITDNLDDNFNLDSYGLLCWWFNTKFN